MNPPLELGVVFIVSILIILLVSLGLIFGFNDPFDITFEDLPFDFDLPIHITDRGIKDELFILEEKGNIIRINENGSEVFFTVPDVYYKGFEQGAFCLEFDNEDKNTFYVTNSVDKDGTMVLRKFNKMTNENEIIKTVNNTSGVRSGGWIGMMKDDIYLAIGDMCKYGDPHKLSKNPNHENGKILKINKITKEDVIIADGMGHPWKSSFQNEDLIVGNSSGCFDEFDTIERINNDGRTIIAYIACSSLVGGIVSKNEYIYGDFLSGNICRMNLETTRSNKQIYNYPGVCHIFKSSSDKVYVVSNTMGTVAITNILTYK